MFKTEFPILALVYVGNDPFTGKYEARHFEDLEGVEEVVGELPVSQIYVSLEALKELKEGLEDIRSLAMSDDVFSWGSGLRSPYKEKAEKAWKAYNTVGDLLDLLEE